MVTDSAPELQGHILVVDDNKLNRMLLVRMLGDLGHQVTQAEDGLQALGILQDPGIAPVDVVLLDILMPELDGYGLLARIKGDAALRSLPVIMISALDELDSVVRCIEIGATDYLTKPVQPGLLKARLKSSLAEKRLRDLEMEYLEQVGFVVAAAESVEADRYDPKSLNTVAARTDALGRLARVFQKMVQEVHLREQRLKQQLAQLRLDMEEMHKAMTEELQIYIPMDRRQALFNHQPLPTSSSGAVLFADISDFTHLTDQLSRDLGRPRGAEEVTRLINQIFAALVDEVHSYRGSVISFSGDAITCWFDDRPLGQGGAYPGGPRALAAGLNMQQALQRFEYDILAQEIQPGIKVAVVAGSAHRFLVGDPAIQNMEALVGNPLERLAAVEKAAKRGEVVADVRTVAPFSDQFEFVEQQTPSTSGGSLVVVEGFRAALPPEPWPDLPAKALAPDRCRPWIHPYVYRQTMSNTQQFMAELRPAAALFVQFQGIDVETEPAARELLDEYIRWVQNILEDEGGTLLQLTFGDKGSYLYAAFGAPVTHTDDAARAIRAGLRVLNKPARFTRIHGEKLGVAYGQMRAGSYGGDTHRTYGVIGNTTNLAARLMQAAPEGSLYCDETTYNAGRDQFEFKVLPPVRVKGRSEPVRVFWASAPRNSGADAENEALQQIGALPASGQLVLKIASVFGLRFQRSLLLAMLPSDKERQALQEDLALLLDERLLRPFEGTEDFGFVSPQVQAAAYQSLLYVQRRHLHRQIAEYLEGHPAVEMDSLYATLAYHWEGAEETTRAVEYLEKAGQAAQAAGNLEQARKLFQKSLELTESRAVLSRSYLDKK